MRNTRKRYNGIGVCCAILLVLTMVLDAVAAHMDAQVGDGDIPPGAIRLWSKFEIFTGREIFQNF